MADVLDKSTSSVIQKHFTPKLVIFHKLHVNLWPKETTYFPLNPLKIKESLWQNDVINKK